MLKILPLHIISVFYKNFIVTPDFYFYYINFLLSLQVLFFKQVLEELKTFLFVGSPKVS